MRHGWLDVFMRLAAVFSLALVAMAACGAPRKGVLSADNRPPDQSLTQSNQERLQALLLARQHGNDGSDYVVSPGDLLVVTIYNFRPEGGNFEAEVRVDDRGYISLPMIEPLRVAGLNAAQLRAAVTAALQQSQVLKQPMVGVFLKDYQGQGVIVLGAVAKPGQHFLSRGGQTLIDVISMAGGLTQNAGNYILLRPADNTGNGSRHLAPAPGPGPPLAPAANSLSGADPNTIVINAQPGSADPMLMAIPMRGGDQVTVPEAGQAFIEGEVAKPGPVPLVYGMTLTQLISAVGGLTYPADRQHVILIRSAQGGESTPWEIDLDRIQSQEQRDVLLERNDRIVVPSTGGKKVAYGVYQTLNAIVHLSVGGAVPLY